MPIGRFGGQCMDGGPVAEPSVPIARTFNEGRVCLRPEIPFVVRTAAQIFAEFPGPPAPQFFTPSLYNCVPDGCGDPACPPCVPCCISNLSPGPCATASCCECGSDVRVTIQTSSRVRHWFDGGFLIPDRPPIDSNCDGQCKIIHMGDDGTVYFVDVQTTLVFTVRCVNGAFVGTWESGTLLRTAFQQDVYSPLVEAFYNTPGLCLSPAGSGRDVFDNWAARSRVDDNDASNTYGQGNTYTSSDVPCGFSPVPVGMPCNMPETVTTSPNDGPVPCFDSTGAPFFVPGVDGRITQDHATVVNCRNGSFRRHFLSESGYGTSTGNPMQFKQEETTVQSWLVETLRECDVSPCQPVVTGDDAPYEPIDEPPGILGLLK